MRLKALKKRKVINIYNGNFIGCISDVVVELPTGNIESLIVRLPFFQRLKSSLVKTDKIIVNWEYIVSIGKDVILVNIIDN